MIHRHPKELMCLKPPSGIGRGYVSGVSRVLDKSKYELPAEYEATSRYVDKFVKDPNGSLTMRDTKEKYRREEQSPVNAGFTAIRKAPLDSIIVVHQSGSIILSIDGKEENVPMEFGRGIGRVPAHDEYYVVKQRTKSTRQLVLVHTTNPRGYYLDSYLGARSMKWLGSPPSLDIKTVKDLQEWFKYSDRITIYEPRR